MIMTPYRNQKESLEDELEQAMNENKEMESQDIVISTIDGSQVCAYAAEAAMAGGAGLQFLNFFFFSLPLSPCKSLTHDVTHTRSRTCVPLMPSPSSFSFPSREVRRTLSSYPWSARTPARTFHRDAAVS